MTDKTKPPPSLGTLPESFLLDSLFSNNKEPASKEQDEPNQQQDVSNNNHVGRPLEQNEDDDDDDAALVDSFFLPGGLLADDDENNNNRNQRRNNFATENERNARSFNNEGLSTTVPSNPWEQSNHNNVYRDDEAVGRQDLGMEERPDPVSVLPSQQQMDGTNLLFSSGVDDKNPFVHKLDSTSLEASEMSLLMTSKVENDSTPPSMSATSSHDVYNTTPISSYTTQPPPGFNSTPFSSTHDEERKELNVHGPGVNVDKKQQVPPPTLTTYSNAAQKRQYTGQKIQDADQNDGKRCGTGENTDKYHPRHSSPSSMGDDLVMVEPSSSTSPKYRGKPNRYSRKSFDTHPPSSSKGNRNNRKGGGKPQGSGRLLLDQPSPPSPNRKTVRSSKTDTKGMVQQPVTAGERRANNDRSSTNLPHRRNTTKNFDDKKKYNTKGWKIESDNKNSNDNTGWHDGRRAHHHHHQGKRVAQNVNTGDFLPVTTVQQNMHGGRRTNVPAMSSNDNDGDAMKNIYESLDVYEQDDDVYDDNANDSIVHGDNMSHRKDGGDNEDHAYESYRADDGDEVDDDNYDAAEDDEDGIDTTSIPLHVCGSSVAASSASSLSTSSDVDSPDESSHSSDELEYGHLQGGEGIGYDTDQAHVSQIIGVGDNSTLLRTEQGSNCSSDPSAVCPAEETPFSHGSGGGDHCEGMVADNSEIFSRRMSLMERVQSMYRSFIGFPSRVVQFVHDLFASRFRQSKFFRTIRQAADEVVRFAKQVKSTMQVLSLWVTEARDATAFVFTQCFVMVGMMLANVTKALILSASFLFQVWKYSLIEAAEESSVTICYLVFYFMPDFCSLLMTCINVPHWSSHLLTWLSVFLLCKQVKPGSLHQEEDISIFRNFTALNSSEDIPSGSELTSVSTMDMHVSGLRSHNEGVKKGSQQRIYFSASNNGLNGVDSSTADADTGPTVPKDERACIVILKVLRIFLPGFFIADGFSSEFGTIMGVNGASRLTTAFMLSLVRKNLVSSPIGWVSWAVQVLLATYFSSWALLDPVVVVVGLSSVRLIRYLDEQRERKRRQRNQQKQ